MADGEIAGAYPTHDVYFVLAETLGLVKIGYARCHKSRLRTMQTNSPDQLRLLGIVVSDNASSLELDLHARYRKQRVRGEWFKADEAMLADIREMCAISAKRELDYLRTVIEMD